MAFDAVGKLHVAHETKQVSDRFTKREFVVEVPDGKYPQFVLFQLTGDRCSALDEFQVGDEVRVTFNLRGREWKSPQGEVKYFNSLDVWKLERASQSRGDSRGQSQSNGRSNGNGGNGGRRDDGFARGSDDFGMREDPRGADFAPRTDDDLPF